MEKTIQEISDFIKRYRSINNVDIIFTLGKYTECFGFEKNLFQNDNYSNILDKLDSCTQWEKVNKTNYTKFNKEPVKTIDTIIFKSENSPYDFIINAVTSKKTEIYVSDNYIQDIISYKRKNHTFNLIKSESPIDGTVYKLDIVLNLNLPKNYTDTYVSHSSLIKVMDMISACNENKNEILFTKIA